MSSTGFHEHEEGSVVSTNSRESFDFNFMKEDLLNDGDSQINVNPDNIPSPSRRPPPPPTRQAFQSKGKSRLVVGIDYGTTFTGLAIATTSSDQADLSQIEVHQDWTTPKKNDQNDSQPNTRHKSIMSNLRKVPSVISFAKAAHGEAQWGADISENSTIMVNVKLELQALNLHEELDLTYHLLKGAHNLDFAYIRKAGPEPAYTFRSPTEIITEYLKRVFECAKKVVDVEELNLTKTPIDVVVTVPVEWGEQANDSMFKAVRAAGFNRDTWPTLRDTILVSEPEAASHFIARHLHEHGIHFLEVNDCFILCDAGGGTADVVSYQVKQLRPFELRKATEPTGGKCGSALIDTAFKEWLRKVIGKERYNELDPANARSQRISPHTAENGKMRKLIKDFENKKKVFEWDPNGPDIKLDLPEPLNHLTVGSGSKVKDGELTITNNEMKDLMDTCVNTVIGLIQDQIDQVKGVQKRRVRNVFLVGGFGASPYLRKELVKSLKFKKMDLRRPEQDSSLTATAQGAVVYGIEKSRHTDCRYMGAITKSYGVLLEGKFEWPIRKGDLIIQNQNRTINSKTFWCDWSECTNDSCDFKVYYYRSRGKDDDDVPEELLEGEVEVAGTIKADFRRLNVPGARSVCSTHPSTLTPGNRKPVTSSDKIGPLKWRLQLSATEVVAELFLKDKSLGKCKFGLETDFPVKRRNSLDLYDDSDE